MDAKAIVGTWEGESKCTVPSSPCKDERVLFRIAADKSALEAHLDASKVVEGKDEPMGTLDCIYHIGELLTCTNTSSKNDYWEFRILRERMIGSLVVGEHRTLYRRITAHRK